MESGRLADHRRVAEVWPPALREAYLRDLEEAGVAVQGRERVEFLRQGLQYLDLTLTAVEKTIPLVEAGWKFDTSALAAWEERDRYVESLEQGFALAYFWIRYNDQNRSCVPLERLGALGKKS